MNDAMDQETAQRLPDLCIDLFAFALQLRKSKRGDDERLLRRQLTGLFSALDREVKEAEIDPENASLAQYALVAFLDEIILSSDWSLRKEWARRPLQLQYFNDFSAGEGFYSKLDSLRGSREAEKLDVLEVYATCLGLGFRGKLADPEGVQKPKILAGEISREIKDARRQAGDELSTHWRREDRLQDRARKVPVWVVASICGGIILLQTGLLNWKFKGEIEVFKRAVATKPAVAPIEGEIEAGSAEGLRGAEQP